MEELFHRHMERLRGVLGSKKTNKLFSARQRGAFERGVKGLRERPPRDVAEKAQFCLWNGELSEWRLSLLQVIGCMQEAEEAEVRRYGAQFLAERRVLGSAWRAYNRQRGTQPRGRHKRKVLQFLGSAPTPFTALSPWHAKVYEEMQRYEGGMARTAWPEVRLRRVSRAFVRFVRLLSDACKPTGVEQFLRDASFGVLQRTLQRMGARLDVQNHRVKTLDQLHHARSTVVRWLHILKGPLREHLRTCDPTALTTNSVLRDIPNRRVAADPLTRRILRPEEVQAMVTAARNPTEALLMTLLQEVALRHSALTHLTYGALLDGSEPRAVCQVREKGDSRRVFVCSANLQARIKAVAHKPMSPSPSPLMYILNAANPRRPLSSTTLFQTVRRIARDAGIQDVAVYPHIFRHTLVDRLFAAGNTAEVVCKFMGHTRIDTTSRFYWVPTIRELHTRLINPFDGEHKQPDDTITTAKLTACRKLLEAALKHCPRDALLQTKPAFFQILDAVDSPEEEERLDEAVTIPASAPEDSDFG